MHTRDYKVPLYKDDGYHLTLFRSVIDIYISFDEGGEKMKIKPEKRENLKLDVKGLGCWDDCQVFYAQTANEKSCGWEKTPHGNIFS